jgi:hypothetical protein
MENADTTASGNIVRKVLSLARQKVNNNGIIILFLNDSKYDIAYP